MSVQGRSILPEKFNVIFKSIVGSGREPVGAITGVRVPSLNKGINEGRVIANPSRPLDYTSTASALALDSIICSLTVCFICLVLQ